MDRWFRLAVASFAGTLTVVMLGAVHLRVARGSSGSAPISIAQAAQGTMSLSMASAAPSTDPRPVIMREVAYPDSIELEPDLFLATEVPEWSPPSWFPDESRDALWALDNMEQAAEPERASLRLRSRAVFVYDIESGEVLLSRSADDRRPVASLTKVIAGLAVASDSPDLDREVCIDTSVRPSWPGAVSRLRTGTCTTGWDLLGAALVRSDNGAAMAFAPIAGLPHFPFVARMNQVAADLAMDMSTFSDPSGVEDDNLSTARDMTRAIYAASLHPTLSPVVSAPYWDVTDRTRGRVKRLLTTNRMHGNPRLDILAGKTGYTDTARHCFSGVFRTNSGRMIAMTTLGAWRGRHRWSDVRRILDWVDRGVL